MTRDRIEGMKDALNVLDAFCDELPNEAPESRFVCELFEALQAKIADAEAELEEFVA